jgi:hypothetical protein
MLRSKFLLKLVVFGITLSVISFIPIAIAIYSGEAMPLWMVVHMQSNDDTVIYEPLNEDLFFSYKVLSIQARHPEVITIGSSRMDYFQPALFNKQPEVVYTLNGPAWDFEKVRSFVAQLEPDYSPQILIIGLDQLWFNETYLLELGPNVEETSISEVDPEYILARTRLVWEYIFADDINLETIIGRSYENTGYTMLGLKALLSGRGYRIDGSRLSNTPTTAMLEEILAEHIYMLEHREAIYRQGQSLAQETLDDLDYVLQTCNEKGIIVIGFFLPFRPSFYDEMKASGEHTYIPQASEQVAIIFERNGFDFFDYSNAAWIGGTDENLFDGWHSTELFATQIYIELLKSLPDVLGEYSDLEYLQNVVANAENPFDIWSDIP